MSTQDTQQSISSTSDASTIINQSRIRQLNDAFRQTLIGGRIVLTHGVTALGEAAVNEIMKSVAIHSEFTEDNDPHGEHDFGAVIYNGQKLFWKIDYYDENINYGSPDPADPSVTTRVLTVMLASEY